MYQRDMRTDELLIGSESSRDVSRDLEDVERLQGCRVSLSALVELSLSNDTPTAVDHSLLPSSTCPTPTLVRTTIASSATPSRSAPLQQTPLPGDTPLLRRSTGIFTTSLPSPSSSSSPILGESTRISSKSRFVPSSRIRPLTDDRSPCSISTSSSQVRLHDLHPSPPNPSLPSLTALGTLSRGRNSTGREARRRMRTSLAYRCTFERSRRRTRCFSMGSISRVPSCELVSPSSSPSSQK
jgi:hypothetical protein